MIYKAKLIFILKNFKFYSLSFSTLFIYFFTKEVTYFFSNPFDNKLL